MYHIKTFIPGGKTSVKYHILIVTERTTSQRRQGKPPVSVEGAPGIVQV